MKKTLLTSVCVLLRVKPFSSPWSALRNCKVIVMKMVFGDLGLKQPSHDLDIFTGYFQRCWNILDILTVTVNRANRRNSFLKLINNTENQNRQGACK